MNSEFVLAQAAALAARLKSETPADFARELTVPLAATFQRPSEAWQFGYGAFDEAGQRTSAFTPLSHWTGSAWQGGGALPDPQIGWVLLHATGGHTGTSPSHAAIRRWSATRKGTLRIAGKLHHPSEHGDGVRGRIVASRVGLAGTWNAQHGEAATDVDALSVEPGDTVDFVVDCVGDVNSDSFTWELALHLAGEQGQPLDSWNSAADFHGPSGVTLPQLVARAWLLAYGQLPATDEIVAACRFVQEQRGELQATAVAGDHEQTALTSLCQQLFSSNEFLYVD
jgi:hypothetical protein